MCRSDSTPLGLTHSLSGVALAADKNVPVVSSMIFVAIFAIFHGHAHGVEMPIVVRPALYALGFITGTAITYWAY
jgi:urease accessory protein